MVNRVYIANNAARKNRQQQMSVQPRLSIGPFSSSLSTSSSSYLRLFPISSFFLLLLYFLNDSLNRFRYILAGFLFFIIIFLLY